MTATTDVYFTQTLKNLPNADILSWDSDNDQGLVLTTTSSNGLTADGACGTNNRDFPLFFLSLPDLPELYRKLWTRLRKPLYHSY